jgi:hypothetical protein
LSLPLFSESMIQMVTNLLEYFANLKMDLMPTLERMMQISSIKMDKIFLAQLKWVQSSVEESSKSSMVKVKEVRNMMTISVSFSSASKMT